METTPYFLAITDHRSMLLDDPSNCVDETISLETQADLARDSVSVALQENFDAFLPYLAMLTPEDRELIPLYYLVEKPQWCLAVVHRSTQTLCSQRLRLAVKRLALMAMFKGDPDFKTLTDVLEEHNLNRLIPGGPTTARLVVEYRRRRSFPAVTDALHCPRPQARRALISSAAILLHDEHEEHMAFGAYIHGLIDQASVQGSGFSDNKHMKCAHGLSTNPTLVGMCRIGDEDRKSYEHVLVSRASL